MENQLSFEESVRKRPAMYLGATGSKGIIELIEGLILEANHRLENRENLFQFTIHAYNRFELKINAQVSLKNLAPNTEKNMGYSTKIYFRVLKILSNKLEIVKEDDFNLKMIWELDESLMGSCEIDFISLSETIAQIAYLNRESEILITDYTKKYKNQLYYFFPEGIRHLYERCKTEALGMPKFEMSFDNKIGENHYQIFIGYRTDWYPKPSIISFANDVQTVCGGSLVNGIIEGLVLGCKEYVDNSNLKDFNVKRSKFNNGLILVCSVRGGDFKYGGSFKEMLMDKQVQLEAKNLTKKLTLDFAKNNKELLDAFLWRFDENHPTSGMMETK